MPSKKKPSKSTREKSAAVADATRRLILQNQYSNSIGRTRSAKGAINAKKKRTKLIREMAALRKTDGIEWLKLARKRRRVSRPLTAILKAKEALGKSDFAGKAKLLEKLDALEAGVRPLLVETQRYIEAAKTTKDTLDTMMQRCLDVDRALLDACGDVYDLQPNYFYATPECQQQILPASVFQLSAWHRNTEKKSNNSTGKVSSKNEAQGKRHATMARQDVPDSIVPHVPDCV